MATRVNQSSNPQEPSRSVNNTPSKMQIIRSSLQESTISAVKKHPILTIGSVVLGVATGTWLGYGAALALNGYLVHREYSSPEQLAQRLGKEFSSVISRSTGPELRELVESFVESNWDSLKFPGYCDNEDNKKFLTDKLFSVLNSRNNSIGEKKQICTNIFANFKRTIDSCSERITSDLQKRDFQQLFQLNPGSTVTNIEILGDETHNKGAIPVLIEVRDSRTGETRKIVYKPRSTLPEQALYGQGGLFASLEGRTYGVLSREGYGYCEFLENREDQNTVESMEEVQSYARSMIILDRVGQRIGLSDLHSDNIITSRKYPFVIDAETVLLPTRNRGHNTDLLNGFRAGYMFEPDVTKNRIWAPKPGVERILNQAIEEANEDRRIDEFVETHAEDIQRCRGTLARENHRIVLISTDELKAQFRDGLERGGEAFIRNLGEGLTNWGFTPREGIERQVRQKFTEDFMNNDIPVFYYNPVSREVSYHGIVLGRVEG